jgi:transposase
MSGGLVLNTFCGKASDPGCTARDNRLFVEAVLWMLRTGSPWRDLPGKFDKWRSTYMRFARWRDHGVWERVADVLGRDADREPLFIGSTIVRAHPHSAGAQKKQGPRNRPFARWSDDQTARSCRCTWTRTESKKLAQTPDIGPIAASDLVASMGDAKNIENGRQLAA